MFIGYPNTSTFVKNPPLRIVFSTLFSVIGYPDKTLFLVFDILLQAFYCIGYCLIGYGAITKVVHVISYSHNPFLINVCVL